MHGLARAIRCQLEDTTLVLGGFREGYQAMVTVITESTNREHKPKEAAIKVNSESKAMMRQPMTGNSTKCLSL